MRLLAATTIVVLWFGACAVAWLVVKDRPLLPSREPAPALTVRSLVYHDRDYRLEAVPEFLEDAVVVRTFRHDAHPVHLRLEGPGVLWFLAVEGDVPAAWGDVEPAEEAVLCRGAELDLTRAYSLALPAGDHVIEPLGPRNIASPLLVVGSAEVHEVETPAGLSRRVELVTRGFPRKSIAAVLAILATIGLALGLHTAARKGRKRQGVNSLHRPDP